MAEQQTPPVAVEYDKMIHGITEAYRTKYAGQYGFKVDKTHYAEIGKHVLASPAIENDDPLLAQYKQELHSATVKWNKDHAGDNLTFWYSGVHMRRIASAVKGFIGHDTQIVRS